MTGRMPVRVVLSLPRTGTHFFWTRYVHAGTHQLIFDADRIPALAVLAERTSAPLTFLAAPSPNPNYNFQYNSMRARPPMSARAHLGYLASAYGCAPDPETLFHAIMARQDCQDRTLLSINRFIYTTRYTFLDVPYGIDAALDALSRYLRWLAAGPYDVRTVMVVRRPVAAWVRSLYLMMGAHAERFVSERLEDFPAVLAACRDHGVAVFDMKEAIAAVARGVERFEDAVSPLDRAAQHDMEAEAASLRPAMRAARPAHRMPLVRFGRLVEYLRERDPVLRAALVRSIGEAPIRLSRFIPFLGRTIRADYDGVRLNNARIR